jgi:hypothetical protein
MTVTDAHPFDQAMTTSHGEVEYQPHETNKTVSHPPPFLTLQHFSVWVTDNETKERRVFTNITKAHLSVRPPS